MLAAQAAVVVVPRLVEVEMVATSPLAAGELAEVVAGLHAAPMLCHWAMVVELVEVMVAMPIVVGKVAAVAVPAVSMAALVAVMAELPAEMLAVLAGSSYHLLAFF